jgi:beta-fructofuranosidase
MQLNYKPDDGWAADFIPFYWQGEYHLFYLKDYRDKLGHGEGTPWCHLVTRDFVHFVDHGECLARGSVEDQDLYVFTGSVLAAEGKFHIFYTGHNPHLRAAGRPEQAIMHAVSDDLHHWKKVPADTFFAPADRFEPHDWRDPFVFWNAEAQAYWMILAARLQAGPSRRRGCSGLCTSTDLVHWEVQAPFYAPGLYYTHECPDVFRMGDWWYLLFSEFSEACVTRYRMARSVTGPWITPNVDTFDGRAFYAAKTAEGDGHRFLFGWNPSQTGQQDYADWNWGGNLVVHEVTQRADGTLATRLPASVKQYFANPQPVRFDPAAEPQRPPAGAGQVVLDAPGSFRYMSAGGLPETALLEATAVFTESTKGLGVMLRASADGEAGYYVRVEPRRGRLVFDAWPRPGDRPSMLELERPIAVRPGQPVQLTVYVDGTICEVYLDHQAAMSARMYNHPAGHWGLFVSEGGASFSDVRLSTP